VCGGMAPLVVAGTPDGQCKLQADSPGLNGELTISSQHWIGRGLRTNYNLVAWQGNTSAFMG
jgi:hypothetical protein